MPQKLSAFRERKLRFDGSKAVRFSRIRQWINGSMDQNRVRFSRPVKENQGLTIVAKAKKTLSAYWLPRKGEEGERGHDTPVATRETWGSGTASPHPSHEWGRCCRASVLDTLRIIIHRIEPGHKRREIDTVREAPECFPPPYRAGRPSKGKDREYETQREEGLNGQGVSI